LAERLQRVLPYLPAVRSSLWRLGRRLYCSARGEPSANNIRTNGEAYVQACVAKALPADTTLVAMDIGANQGEWTLSLLEALPAERRRRGNVEFHLFEPVPTTVETLRRRVDHDEFGKIAQIHSLAMSDKSGAASIAVMSETGGTNSLHLEKTGGTPPGGWVGITTVTLTEFTRQHGIEHIHLAKSDTEGHDLAVLRGARELLSARRIDVFQFEYNHRWVFSRSFLKDAFELIEGLPYRLGRIMPSHLEIFESWHPELERFFEANYVLVDVAALGWFDARSGRFNESNIFFPQPRKPAPSPAAGE
jgi:FkbM family methyltransferase